MRHQGPSIETSCGTAYSYRVRRTEMELELAPPPAAYLNLIISAPLARSQGAYVRRERKNPSIRGPEGFRTAVITRHGHFSSYAHRAFWLGSHGSCPGIRSANSAPGRYFARSPSSHQTLNTGGGLWSRTVHRLHLMCRTCSLCLCFPHALCFTLYAR